MKYSYSILKPNDTDPIATTVDVTFSDGTNEFSQNFVAKQNLQSIKTEMKKHGGFTNEEIENYAPKIKAQLNQWNEAADYPITQLS